MKRGKESFQEEDEAKRALWESGKITEKEYISWRRQRILQTKHYSDMVPVLAEDLTNADKIAMSTVCEYMPEVYAVNANYGTYEIEHGTSLNTSWTLYDRDTVENLFRQDRDILPQPAVDVPADQQWNRKHINNAITQGILQGDSIPNIAKRLESVVGMDYNAAVRNARTATTSAQNAGRISSYERAEKLGINLKKEWHASLDNRTRHQHRILDGQQAGVHEMFEVEGDEIEYPGDPRAPGYLIYNCRCYLVAAIEGHDQSNAPRASKLGDMTYEEWKIGKSSGDTNSTFEVFHRGEPENTEFKPISAEDFEREMIWVRKQGTSVYYDDPWWNDHLKSIPASASTLGTVSMAFRSGISLHEVLEEKRHLYQNIIGMNDDKDCGLRELLNEIEAREYILSIAKERQLPRAEIDAVKSELRYLIEDLGKYTEDAENDYGNRGKKL